MNIMYSLTCAGISIDHSQCWIVFKKYFKRNNLKNIKLIVKNNESDLLIFIFTEFLLSKI